MTTISTKALPPGIIYLLHHIPQLLIGPISTYLFLKLSQSFFLNNYNFQSTTWVTVVLLTLSGPVLFAILLAWDDLKNYRAARAIGAILPPRIPDYSPGNIYSIWKDIRTDRTGYFGDGIDDLAAYCGGYAFNTRILFQNRMVTAEPEHIKEILATQFEKYEKGPEFREITHPLLGSGVFAADGELWKFHRSMTRPFFTKDRISHFENFDRHADEAINQIKTRFREGYAVDIQDVAARFTLDSATEFLFGNDVHSLTAGIPYPHNSPQPAAASEESATSSCSSSPHTARFAKAFSEAQLVTLDRARFGLLWPLFEFWHDKMEKPMRIVHELIDPIVADAVAKRKVSDSKKESGDDDKIGHEKTLLEDLASSTDDPILLRDEIMSLLVAGRDTTASTLTFVVYMLAEHPDVLRKLREEILTKVGSNRRPTYEDMKDMKYLRAVINETLRLYPAVPFNLRMSKGEATTWSPSKPGNKPFYIPPNTRIGYTVFSMHRRLDLWGPDALEFDPDRFLDERLHKYLIPNPFIFLPFNAGPRICLGQQFAYNESSFFLVRLLQNFSTVSLSEESQPPDTRAPKVWLSEGGRKAKEKIKPRAHLTMFIQGGLWVKMEEAKSTDL
ncbi:cytochrome P450 [Phlegmacium glaucopus]|nr:cytochrome P450 [Phlegmacium glaucopus]